MKGVEIREATASDISALMAWRMEVLHEVFSIPAGTDTFLLADNNRAYYEKALADGSHVACFAEHDGKIIGCGGVCLYQEMPSPDNVTGRCAYLMNIYVRPEHRHEGVGRAIVAWLTGRAEVLGITKIYLETSDAGRNLYRYMGFEEMKDMMKKQ